MAAAAGRPAILPGVRITADAVNNSLLIYANQENYRIIEQTLHQLDRPQLQVSIDATIAEITLNDSLNYGVQYFLQSKDVGAQARQGLGRPRQQRHQRDADAARCRASTSCSAARANPRIVLDALRAVSDVKVLSAPSVVVLDNQVATLQVGDQIPVTTAVGYVLSRRRHANRQHHRLSQHRRDPARGAAHQCQRQRAARHRAGDQQRRRPSVPTR